MNNIQVTNFIGDEIEGHKAEDEILLLIQKKYPLAEKVEGYHKEFDINVPEVQSTIEVKYDKKSAVTGNYFIETSFNGEDSGIKATKADWWVIVDNDSICFIQTDALKSVLKSVFSFERVLRGNDGTKIGYRLIKKETLLSYPYAKSIPRKNAVL